MSNFVSRLALLVASGALVTGFAACSSDDDDAVTPLADAGADAATTSSPDATTSVTPTTDAAVTLTDAQIVQLLHSIDQDEMAEAKIAESMGSASAVLSFATSIDHASSSADQSLSAFASDAGLVAADSPTNDTLTSGAVMDEQDLRELTNGAFDLGYVRIQLATETEVLGFFDADILPSVHDAGLATVAQAQRAMIASQVEQAQAILDAGLTDAGSTDGGVADASADAGDADEADAGD